MQRLQEPVGLAAGDTEAVQEEILETLIQIKRMLGGLLSGLGWGRLPESSRSTAGPESSARGKAEGCPSSARRRERS